MLRIKRLYTFMLQTFLPLFAMTFFIVLFIVLMQFLWRYIDDLVNKGLDISVIAELFFYAALTFVPMALPLAILLASLMTFGNLGEKFELTAMKASGVSLMKVMRPLTILMIFIAGGAFVFQNNVLPVAQTKMWTLLFSMRQTKPEQEIKEQVFNDDLNGYSIYVDRKDKVTGMLYDVIVYDTSAGAADNARIVLADSGKITAMDDKAHMSIMLYDGQWYENVRRDQYNGSQGMLPYRSETFRQKQILVPYDANFNRIDESGIRKQYVGKNMAELNATIDSLNLKVDSIGNAYANEMLRRNTFSIQYDSPYRHQQLAAENVPALSIDSLVYDNVDLDSRRTLTQALAKAQQIKQEFEYKGLSTGETRKNIRRHEIELHKKFTLSFACIIMFFIGAPLGAIIRKGGLGLPMVVSVILFIIYYIIDNTGYKLARDGRMDVMLGMWLSSIVLLPLGIFLTYKAMRDSNLFNFSLIADFFARFKHHKVRLVEYKEVAIDDVIVENAIALIDCTDEALDALEYRYHTTPFLLRPFRRFICRKHAREALCRIDAQIDYLSNSRDRRLVNLLNNFPSRLTLKDIHSVREVNSRLRRGFINKEWKDYLD